MEARDHDLVSGSRVSFDKNESTERYAQSKYLENAAENNAHEHVSLSPEPLH